MMRIWVQLLMPYFSVKSSKDKDKPILLSEAARKACEQDSNIKCYLLGENCEEDSDFREKLKLSNNWHLKEALDLLKNDKNIQIMNEKLITMK